MTNIAEVIEEIKDFSLFQDVLRNILTFETNISSKIWTLELLTNYMNQLIQKFLASRESKISVFFAKYLKQRFDNNRKQQKYCFTLILSLFHFKDYYYYIGNSNQIFILGFLKQKSIETDILFLIRFESCIWSFYICQKTILKIWTSCF